MLWVMQDRALCEAREKALRDVESMLWVKQDKKLQVKKESNNNGGKCWWHWCCYRNTGVDSSVIGYT